MSCEFNPKRLRHIKAVKEFKEIGTTVTQFLDETKDDIENVLLEKKLLGTSPAETIITVLN